MHQLLIQIANGNSIFDPESKSTTDMLSFQNLVALIRKAEKLGYIKKITLHEERETGNDYFDAVHINEITQNGLDLIKLQHNVTKKLI